MVKMSSSLVSVTDGLEQVTKTVLLNRLSVMSFWVPYFEATQLLCSLKLWVSGWRSWDQFFKSFTDVFTPRCSPSASLQHRLSLESWNFPAAFTFSALGRLGESCLRSLSLGQVGRHPSQMLAQGLAFWHCSHPLGQS